MLYTLYLNIRLKYAIVFHNTYYRRLKIKFVYRQRFQDIFSVVSKGTLKWFLLLQVPNMI